MRFLSDKAVERLREAAEIPDLTGTRYRLLERVARGGMGVVYVAEDEKLQRRVALKVLDVPSADRELATRLIREALVLARLEHPGIVPVHDVGTLADGRVFYTMKFVQGLRLDQYIEAVSSVTERLRLSLRICEAVAFAHAHGVLHRDLKPANIMVGSFGEVLVMDWGLAKLMREDAGQKPVVVDPERRILEKPGKTSDASSRGISVVTGHGTVMGTPGYMSPEQARGDVEHLDVRSDIFSLGALIRFLLTKNLGVVANVAGKQQIDKALKAICSKATSPDPECRYPSVSELALDVSRYLDGLAVAAHRESFFEKLTRFYRRYQFFILLIAAYLVMRVVILFFMHR
ncbi:MAG TPA: serine/threonine-protein kinase [Candidatus Dormibacteraeota bacterium]|nr:serine/threonine-protein kinase [Candidatus Dormibacteraeota bacterium]